MLASKYRLPLRTELNRIRQEGKLIQGRLFSLQVGLAKSTQPSRFGFIISSKIDKKAVRRNRAKRLLSEAVNKLRPQLRPGYEVVVLAKKKIIGADYQAIEKEFKALLNKAGMVSQ
ncbi:MAG: ribonuclease P protein component [Candidatus Marinimicrobia bacterium]|nr:ribonuclease P protein component [Candidatus Neomarinimicrobiota bacterium]